MVGDAPFYAILHDARERGAQSRGQERGGEGHLLGCPDQRAGAPGRGMSMPTCWSSATSDSAASPGGCLGSVPIPKSSRRVKTDVLIVHTAD